MRVEGKIEQDNVAAERRQREKQGIGTEDEDLGSQPEEAIAVDLPIEMVDALRIDLSVWKPRAEPQRYAAAKATSDDVSATADNLSETALT